MADSTLDGAASSNDSDGSKQNAKKESKSSGAESAMEKLSLQELIQGMAASTARKEKTASAPDMSKHKFWGTQPVPRFNDEPAPAEGPIDAEDPSRVRAEPYTLIDGFEWVTMDLNEAAQLEDVYQLLYQNYVEDTEAMFRFNYSPHFLRWALKSPGWRREWHVGIRATKSRKLVAFISGVPCTLRVRSASVRCSEINFLCVHKKLRDKRLAPVLIKEITRRCNLVGIWQAIYTAGVLLPTPVSACRYYHRPLNWSKLYDVGFSQLLPGSTRQRQTLRYKVAEHTATQGLRAMRNTDVDQVLDLLRRYLSTMALAQDFTRDEVQHWLVNTIEDEKDQVVHTYVVEDADGNITDFFSFYCIESTVIGNDKHKSLKVAYLFYYASEAAFVETSSSSEKSTLKKRLNELINDALILAKKANFDVFNALTLLDNPLFLTDQRFGAGDGRLHYYLYNYRTAPIPGGVDPTTNQASMDTMRGVGVVML